MKWRWRIATAAVLSLVIAAGGYFVALRALKTQIVQALGPRSEIGSIGLSLSAVEIAGLRVRAATPASRSGAWPVEDELRAARVMVEPDLRSLLSSTLIVRRVRIEQAYLPILRTAQGLRLLPSLIDAQDARKGKDGTPDSGTPRTLRIGTVELADGEVDFFDATLGRPLHRIALRNIEGHLDNLKLPALDEPEVLQFRASIPAAGGKGSFALTGQVTPANLDSNLKLTLRDVPLSALQPYFVKAGDTRVRRGSLQLELDSTVRRRHLHAPGTLTLQGLELAGEGSFAGLTRQAAVALLKDRRERIDLRFTLEGNLDDPKFSLNEQFYVRIGAALAETIGLSVESLGKGAAGVAQGLGGTIKRLFGGR